MHITSLGSWSKLFRTLTRPLNYVPKTRWLTPSEDLPIVTVAMLTGHTKIFLQPLGLTQKKLILQYSVDGNLRP